MKPAILLLAAAATIGAAPSRPSRPATPERRYEAGGFEPSWWLVIESGWLNYNPNQGDMPPIRVRVPPRQPVRNGYRYVVPGLTVDVRHERCDSYNGQTFADTVTVAGVAEPGCGGVAIPPDTLRYSGWEVTFFDGIPAGHDNFTLFFQGDGRLTGHAGCSDFVMTYREQRPLLRLGPMRVTRRGCEGMGADVERRALRILAGTMRMNFFDGDNLRLSGRGGVLRAQH
jgi:heat shock protein HslJ